MIELSTINGTSKAKAEKQISADWTDGVMYRGLNVFDTVYDWDRDDSIFGLTEELLPESHQECYLGYIAEQDRFVIGFDTWPRDEEDEDYGFGITDEPSNSVFFFTLTAEGKIKNLEPMGGMDSTFYRNNWKKLKELYPSLYDVRLD